ncbi:EamA family transporter [Aquirufa nivalisilvae]|uniref:DMT family transporter n=1 Tax=Aquirufa nivalisilvae TaxID=2516557 RepID=UPI0022A95D97|nr:EamA family transporter [Aquirufa nivalisilvae]MCZ2481632.1 EamA family transporter [Aquirufa nivalisilvae]
MKNIVFGLLFAMLWSSAAVATKMGILSVHPFILANVRLIVAGIFILLISLLFQPQHRIKPSWKELRQLSFFGLFNSTIYLGAFVMAIKFVSPGIGSLATATNPIFITMLSALLLQRKPQVKEVGSLILGLSGILVASFPQLTLEPTVWKGLLILIGGIITVSAATVYYVRTEWKLNSFVINGWQVLLGGIFLLPFTAFFASFSSANFDLRFLLSVAWLIFPVSIAALWLWFYLIDQDPISASLWMFLCPVFGYIYAYLFSGESISAYTIIGTVIVIVGLYVGKKQAPVSSN